MHTVNKAYTVLKQEGYLQVDRRKGAFIAIADNHNETLAQIKEGLRVLLARCRCKSVSREELHRLMDEIYEEYGGSD
jgi:DNA-binding transcriptional regulator YhcF (GntR family)